MRSDASGNVGIGNTNPGDFDGANAQRLVVGAGTGHDGMTIFSSATDSGTIAFGDSASGAAAYAGRISYAHNTNALSFYTGGNTFAMTIDSSQNVGIGTTVPGRLLDLYRDTGGGDIPLLLVRNTDSQVNFLQGVHTIFLSLIHI